MGNELITLLFQGPWTPDSAANVAATRAAFPGAAVILSVWAADADKVPAGLADDVVVSDDPGALPPSVFGKGARPNNVNRQIVGTRAGLARVTTPYVAKLRTDCVLASRAVVHLACLPEAQDRIVVSSFYTLHPEGIEAFQFHVSDWFQFGRTEQVRAYWDVAPMTLEDARWFEGRPHPAGSNCFARRYRARFAPEQHVAVAYARVRGYRVPASIGERDAGLVAECERFLVTEFIVERPVALGLVCRPYVRLAASHYQFFNCVSGADWRLLREKHEQLPSRQRSHAAGPGVLPAARNRARVVSLMRKIDTALPWIKKAGCMPLVGKCLAFYR